MKLLTVIASIAACLISPIAAASEWEQACKTDSMTDKVTCQLQSKQAKILVLFEGKKRTPTYICIYAHDFPGREGAIRVDKNKAVDTTNDGCVDAGALLQQMKRGRTVRVQAYEWPDDFPKDFQGSLTGFADAVSTLRGAR